MMSAGRAHGDNRKYQLLCRDVLMREHHDLRPFEGDGVDVPLGGGGTVWTFDVALRDQEDKAVIAECRRRKQVVKQGDGLERAAPEPLGNTICRTETIR